MLLQGLLGGNMGRQGFEGFGSVFEGFLGVCRGLQVFSGVCRGLPQWTGFPSVVIASTVDHPSLGSPSCRGV
jgi:hypothetical protein